MLNGWKLAVAAAISGGLTGSIGSEALEGGVIEPMTPPAELIQRAERVSVEFSNASVREVLDWLKHKKVNFVAAESELNRDTKISLNVENAPLGDVVNSIATALGGRWVKDGEMRVFKRGQFWGPGEGSGMYRYGIGEQVRKEMEEAMKSRVCTDKDVTKFYPKDFEIQRLKELEGVKGLKGLPGNIWVNPNWEKMTPEQRAKFEKDMAERMKITEKAMEKVHRDMELRMKDMPSRVYMSPNWEKMSPEERAKFEQNLHERMKITEKTMEKVHRDMELRMKDMPSRVFMAPNWEKMSPEERAKFEKSMAEGMRISEKALEEMRKNFGDGRVWIKPGKGGEGFMPLDVEKINSKALKEMQGVRVLRTSNLKDLVSSLTPDQLERHRRDGFLTPQDLTERQRKMLGMEGDGDWTIVYSADGKKLTFKSKK